MTVIIPHYVLSFTACLYDHNFSRYVMYNNMYLYNNVQISSSLSNSSNGTQLKVSVSIPLAFCKLNSFIAHLDFTLCIVWITSTSKGWFRLWWKSAPFKGISGMEQYQLWNGFIINRGSHYGQDFCSGELQTWMKNENLQW